jgi:hypothetical protein
MSQTRRISNLAKWREAEAGNGPTIETAIRATPVTAPPPQRARSTHMEREFACAVEAWLRDQSLPADTVLWFPHWNNGCPVNITGAAQLAHLIGALEVQDWGGVRNAAGDGRWAQVKCVAGQGTFLELHPYQHDRASRPFVWDSFPNLGPRDAATRAWRWVHTASRT